MHSAGCATMLIVATSLQSTFKVQWCVYAVPFPIGLRTRTHTTLQVLCRYFAGTLQVLCRYFAGTRAQRFAGRGLHPAVACCLGFYQPMDQICNVLTFGEPQMPRQRRPDTPRVRETIRRARGEA